MRWKRLTVRSRPDEQTEAPMPSDQAEQTAERLWRDAPLATGGVCGLGQDQWQRVAADLIRPLIAEAERLKAELGIRTQLFVWGKPPEWCRGNGARSAYQSGFESAWRGATFHQVYERSDCNRAYIAGYEAGERESLAAIDAARAKEQSK